MNRNPLSPLGQRTKNDPQVIGRVKAWSVEQFRLPEETGVMVTELRCAEEGCPPIETVIAILDTPGRPRQYKVCKPMAEVTREDLAAVAAGPGPHAHHHPEEEHHG